MRKTRGRLADGREIIYFDESDDAQAARCLVDSRSLSAEAVPAPAAPAVRYDMVAEEWVTVAPHRQDRTHLPPDEACPLCPSREGSLTEIPSADYDVVVFENRFPAFAGPGGRSAGRSGDLALDESATWLSEQSAVGRCEIVCFTSDHNASFSALTPSRVRTVVEVWADRTEALSALPTVAQVFCFENRGREIGVTLTHPHGQVYGYPFVTPRTRRMLDAARRYRTSSGGADLFADLLASERAAGTRVVAESELWTAFVPFAARWPVEVHLYPNRPRAGIPSLSDAERDQFCDLYLDLLRRLEAVHGPGLPYIAAWHQAPVGVDDGLAYLHLEITSVRRAPGKLKFLAGSESAMGAFITDLAPEPAALALREATPRF